MSHSTARPALSKQDSFRRETFTTSRLLDYFSEKELTLQTGHDGEYWPDVLVKELVDNALDAAEDAGVQPEITVSVKGDSLSVADNGPGLAPEIVTRILDFSTKTSSKDFYISPTRGTQGNALKTVLAIPFVLSGGQSGTVKIESRGIRHIITVGVDRIRQEPKIEHRQEQSVVKNGAVVTISACLEEGAEIGRFLQRVRNYALLNPHAAFDFRHSNQRLHIQAANGQWQKWLPSDPTSPHWYSLDHLSALIAAYVAAEHDGGQVRFVRDLVAEFRGLSATAKQKRILGDLGLAGTRLVDLAKNGDIDREIVARLLEAMKAASRPVKPEALGRIGEDYIRCRLKELGCNEHSIRYECRRGTDGEQRPYMVEIAFGAFEDQNRHRDLICGLNFSPTIGDPFRELAGYQGLDGLLSDQFMSEEAPVCFVLLSHRPAFEIHGPGQEHSGVMNIGEEIQSAVLKATKDWAKVKRQTIRSARAGERARERMMRAQYYEVTIKDVVFENMEQVYATVSGNGQYPALARQMFYQMRPVVLKELPDKELDSQYFTQNLLPLYIQEHPEESASLDVVYDERGRLTEPHTDRTIGIGTLAVRKYLAECKNGHDAAETEPPSIETDFETHGPANRFQNVLYIEKEGFLPLLEEAQIAERFDLAIMSSKGMGSTSARQLMEGLCGVRILVLHDFDKAGFSIVGTVQRDTRRFQFSQSVEVVDLGLRLADVRKEHLTGEPVRLRGDPQFNLRENGATEEEIAYLTGSDRACGQRVELNAMTSPQFIAFLERKLKQHAVCKVVPGKAVLKDAYRRAFFAHRMNGEMDALFAEISKEAEDVAVPKNLEKRVQAGLRQHPEMSWDGVVSKLAGDYIQEDGL